MEFKQVIVVRKELRMGMGKLAAQVAHAAVSGAEHVMTSNPSWFMKWFSSGQAKIVVKVHSLEDLHRIKRKAQTSGLPVVQVQDRGLTQIPEGTITCLGIGPAPSPLIDRITKDLKLL
ncbi:MAG TPA: peptidyl-tRNA hydrolase Pth2 [Nitrososphaeraceae archaeon]|nr:peptidyl-tRNA hydrolase Pth2 [Nitrososphaeraceae archaeon]